MPAQPDSRYFMSPAYRSALGDDDSMWVETQEPYRYVAHHDNRIHVITQGDTLWGLATIYFTNVPNAEHFWWAIADFQPDPILDPTLELEAGRILYIMSIAVLRSEVLGEHRREADVVA